MTLRPYQEEGVEFLHSRKRAILADWMGMGKTAQAVRAAERSQGRVLVVCPKIARAHWADQIRRWGTAESDVVIVDGRTVSARDRQIQEGASRVPGRVHYTIINYENIGIRRVPKTQSVNKRHLPTLLSQNWDVIILDEAHKFKNRNSRMFSALKKLASKDPGTHIYMLTGTPILNRPEEVWPMLHLIDPNKHSSYWRWVFEWCWTAPSRWSINPVIVGVKEPEAFRDMLSAYMIRREKSLDIGVPEVSYEDIGIDIDGDQLKVYRSIRDKAFAELKDGSRIEAVNALSTITRLQQVCVSPDLLTVSDEPIEGAKIDALREILDGAGDQKVVVFSHFASALRRIDIPGSVRITGDMNNKQRESAIYGFQTDREVRAILVSTLCGGTSIDLTAGSIVVFLDYLFTPALNDQAVSRVHRFGQTRPVTVYNLLVNRSIEQWVWQVLRGKTGLIDNLVVAQTIMEGVSKGVDRL